MDEKEIKVDPELKKQFRKEAKLVKRSIEEFLEKINQLPRWTTNVGLAFLGFFVALLIQMKSSNYEFNILDSILFFLFNLTSIIIGFVLRVTSELILFKREKHSLFHKIAQMMDKVSELLNIDSDQNLPSIEEKIKGLIDKDKKIERDSNRWFNAIAIQLCCLFLSFIIMIQVLFKYIYL